MQISNGRDSSVVESDKFFPEAVARMTIAVFVGPLERTQDVVDMSFKIVRFIEVSTY